jgi:OOP family OmpA-OmpF porin
MSPLNVEALIKISGSDPFFPTRRWLGCFFLCSLLTGCGAERIPATFGAFEPVNLDERAGSGGYTGKIENFVVIMDTSSTMNQQYLYEVFDSNTTPTLFEVEKEVIRRLNQAIPAMSLNAGLRTFGFGSCQSWRFSLERLKLGPYDKKTFGEALSSIECASGGSPMDFAIDIVSSDLESVKGKTGIILISDGDTGDDAALAVVEIKKQYGERVCVHTISLGKNPGNRHAMRRLAALSRCGYTTTAEELATGSGMAEFVQKVFIKSN